MAGNCQPSGNGGCLVGGDPSQKMFFGGAGGSGGADEDGHGSAGANGGGLIYLATPQLIVEGTLSADGEPGAAEHNFSGCGSGGGGGGAGGTILIKSQETRIGIGLISAILGSGGDNGGNCGQPGGAGSDGVVRIEAEAIIGVTMPTHSAIYTCLEIGACPGNARDSCQQILAEYPEANSGIYWIQPNTGCAIQAFCAMESGTTLIAGYQVNNDWVSIQSGYPDGMIPFPVTQNSDAELLETFVTQNSTNNSWYLANVFAGPDTSCNELDLEVGYLNSSGAWIDSNIDEDLLAPLNLTSNCNSARFDPIPLNDNDGFANRACSNCLYNSTERIETGIVVCTTEHF